MAFLYDILLQEFGKRAIAQVTVPNHITDNLKSGFGQRPYQIEAFQRLILKENPKDRFTCFTIWQQVAERL